MEQYLSSLAEYGVLGLAVIFLIYYLIKKEQDFRETVKSQQDRMEAHLAKDSEAHREERKAWREEMNCRAAKTNEVIDRNTSVVNELKGIIKSIYE